MKIVENTIQRKLLLLLLAVGIVPAAAAVLHVHWGTLVGVDVMLGGFLQDHAEDTADNIDASLARYSEAAAGLARAAAAGPLPDRSDLFRETAVVDLQGRPEGAAAPRFSIPASLKSPDAPDRVFVHEVAYPKAGALRLLFIAPVAGEPRRLLVAEAETTRVIQSGNDPLVPGQSVSVHSSRGLTAGGQKLPADAADAARQRMAEAPVPGWTVTPGPEGSRLLAGYAVPKMLRSLRNDGLTSADWLVVSRMNAADATALFSFLLWRSFLFGLTLIPALIVLSYWLTRRFLRPVRHLHEQVDRLAGGDLGARVNISTGDELESLGNAFNDMARALDFSQAALEEQIRIAEGKARQITLVHNIAGAIIAAFDLPRLFSTAHEQLSALIPHDAMTAAVFDPAGDGAAVYETAGSVFPGAEAEIVRLYCENRFNETEQAQVLDPGRGGGALPPAGPPEEESPVASGFGQVCLLPLRAETGLIGALALGRTGSRRFSDPELRTLVQVGQVLAVAVEHVRLYERLEGFAVELEGKVTERAAQLQLAQDKLIQSERFAATGRLAASIAHEINNPLGIIKNYLRILRDRTPGLQDDPSNALTVVNEELDRIARIVRNLLYFYRPSSLKQAELDLNEEVRVLLPLMEGGFRRKRIRVETDLEENLPRPVVSPDHIRQVLLNLLKNAEDAVADRGTIRLRTRREESPSGIGTLLLEIEDDGCGIDPDDLAHIFEPFFTSKRDGQGTGLGLSVTYGIVRNLGGSVEVKSVRGVGTTAAVRIPAEGQAIPMTAE